MSTSGSTDFGTSAQLAITRAFRLIGAVKQGQTPPGEYFVTGLWALNALIKGLRNDDCPLHARATASVTVVADTVSYALSPRALRVWDVTYLPTGGNERPLREMTDSEYRSLPDKTVTGDPWGYWIDYGLAITTMYVINQPDSASGTIPYAYERVLEDIDALANDIDVPQEHLKMIVWVLARDLAPEFADYSRPNVGDVIAEANRLEQQYRDASRPQFYELTPEADIG